MRLLRTVTTIVALVVSGLALVAVAPAPPAVAAATSFSQGSLVVTESPTEVCTTEQGTQTESAWLRRFHLDELAIYGTFSPSSVTFGVGQLAPGPSGAISLRVRVYRYPAADSTLTWAELQDPDVPYLETDVDVTDDDAYRAITVVPSLGFFGTFDPATEDAVVEISYAGGVVDERFGMGSNSLAETAPGFFRYAGCGLSDEIRSMDQLAALEDTNIVIALNGENGIDADRDGDRVPDDPDRDACPGRPGPRGGAYPGCPSFVQALTATYDAQRDVISGTLSLTGHDDVSCLDPVTVTLLDAGTDEPLASTQSTSGTSRTFEFDATELDDGAPVEAVVAEYFDRDEGDGKEGLASCLGSTASATVGSKDTDGDGLRDSDDDCVSVRGDTQAMSRRGCPRLQQQVTAELVDGAVEGLVSVERPAGVPVDACAGPVTVEVSRVGADGGLDPLGRDESADGAYSVAFGDPPDGTKLLARALRYDTESLAVCLRGDSEVLEVVRDEDADGWRDLDDTCVAVGHAGPSVVTGCPDLVRTVDASYADGHVTGTVTFTADDVSSTACDQPQHTQIQVSEVVVSATGEVELRPLASGHYSPTDGTYDLPIDLAAGRFFEVAVSAQLDSDAGWCGAAESVPLAVPEPDRDADGVVDDVDACPAVSGAAPSGCPTLARSVTASYVDGAITGQVRVAGPGPAAAGTCLSTRVTAYTIAGDGSQVAVGSASTSSEGRYTVTVGGGLAAGTTYVVRSPSHLAGDVAICAATESAQGVVPTPSSPPPGAALVAPALSGVTLTRRVIHVTGSVERPRRTSLKLRLNVEATVLVTMTRMGKVNGRKVRATVSRTLGAGPSSIGVTGRLGRRSLPAGSYRLRVHAANAGGAAQASAGSLRIKP